MGRARQICTTIMTPGIKIFFTNNVLAKKVWMDEDGHFYPAFHKHKQLIEVTREEALKEDIKSTKK